MMKWRGYLQPPRQGLSHKKYGIPCQDMSYIQENDKVIVAVLADGLGQFEYSSIAADMITENISIYLLNYDYNTLEEQHLKEDILSEARKVLNKCSDKSNISMFQMDCTLLFAVVFKDGSKFIFGQLGDGVICACELNQAFQVFDFDDEFKASANLVKTVQSEDAINFFHLIIYPVCEIVGIFLTTDGLENEVYSKASKVKKKLEWYYNLISNNKSSVCEIEIQKRWDKLTSDEKYGFTDDMSLIAIVLPNQEIELPEDANWLCVCGNRNRLESALCEKCRKDFLKVYKGVNFRQKYGGKLAFFKKINEQPQKELSMLRNYCEYPIEFTTLKSDENHEKILYNLDTELYGLSSTLPLDSRQEERKSPDSISSMYTDREMVGEVNILDQTQAQYKNEYLQQHQIYPTQNNTYIQQRYKKSGISKTNTCTRLSILVAILLFATYSLYDIVTKTKSKIDNLQIENAIIQLENRVISKNAGILNARITELQKVKIKNMIIYDNYSYYILPNGEIYIGQLSEGLPNGMGVIYSSGVLLSGRFLNGMKNGEFLYLFENGNSEIRIYKEDKYINEINLPANNTSILDSQFNDIDASKNKISLKKSIQ